VHIMAVIIAVAIKLGTNDKKTIMCKKNSHSNPK